MTRSRKSHALTSPCTCGRCSCARIKDCRDKCSCCTLACGPRRPTRTSLKSRADALWSKRIHERDRICQFSAFAYDPDDDCWGRLEAAHHIGRSNHATRWELDCGTLLCAKHHGQYDRSEFDRSAFILSRIGPERLARLHELSRQGWDGSYERVLASLTAASTERSIA